MAQDKLKKVLVFGATGTIGSYLVKNLSKNHFKIIPLSRDLSIISDLEKIEAVVWAQGINLTKEFLKTSDSEWHEIWEANLQFIINSLRELLINKCLINGSKLVVISSIWQNLSRTNKTAYITSKTAVGGLVRALSSELGSKKITINALLPGVIDTPMTSNNLTPTQIKKIINSTPTKQLIELKEVLHWVNFLISNSSDGLNGQSIVLDNGWSIHREI